MQLVFDNLQELKAFIAEFLPGTAVNSDSPAHTANAAVSDGPALPAKRGRKPKALSPQAESPASEPKAPRASKSKSGLSLTDRIRKVIDGFIADNKEFTANDVYHLIYKKDKEVNKQSVITSVLKQMNGMYVHIRFEERQGNGPRNVKVYIPE